MPRVPKTYPGGDPRKHVGRRRPPTKDGRRPFLRTLFVGGEMLKGRHQWPVHQPFARSWYGLYGAMGREYRPLIRGVNPPYMLDTSYSAGGHARSIRGQFGELRSRRKSRKK
jgi:hypothetical protein